MVDCTTSYLSDLCTCDESGQSGPASGLHLTRDHSHWTQTDLAAGNICTGSESVT